MGFMDGFPGGENSAQNRNNAQQARDFGRAMEKIAFDFLNGNKLNTNGLGGSRNTMASQSAMRDRINGSRADNFAPQREHKVVRGGLDGFEDGIKEEFLKSIAGDDVAGGIKAAMDEFTKQFGVSLHDLPNAVGKEMMKNLMNTDIGQSISGGIKNLLSSGLDKLGKGGDLGKALSEVGNSFLKGASNTVDMVAEVTESTDAVVAGVNATGQAATSAASDIISLGAGASEATAGAEMAGGAMSAVGASAGPVAAIASSLPPILVALAAIMVVLELVGPALEGLVEVFKVMGQAALRNDTERAKRLENAQARLKSDIEYMVKQPFEILNQAATEWYSTWDANLKNISQTQGYAKEDVYNLYSSYAERLTEEGLSSVISSTDIIGKLNDVINTGLSGKVAEEFAYVATKLNNAIPNEDFFSYAATYAEIASNAIAQGASQEEALSLANQQLETFASNLLYSSRELAGGFSTGLKGASSLFENSVKIAQSAKVGDAANISGTLTSVSAIIGAIAPDLAGGLVDNIVKAAIGGNSETIVALRSLAGINASNTEFLKAIATDPKSVFTNLFNKLAELQNMSNDNFMEVAEGLSGIFGVDMGAFARVDFNYLAEAISQMQVNQNSLTDNIELLKSGESTTTAEQAKMAQINEMILNDGLSVVIDSEAARMVQQHMWDEQLANDMMSATYAIDMQGSALKLIEGIAQTVTNIIRFLNPIGALTEFVSNISETLADTAEQQTALSSLLEQGAVKTNASALADLRNYSGTGELNAFGDNLANVNTRLTDMLFGGHETSSAYGNFMSTTAGMLNTASTMMDNYVGNFGGGAIAALRLPNSSQMNDIVNSAINMGASFALSAGYDNSTNGDISSRYGWGTVGKRASRIANARYVQGNEYISENIPTVTEENERNKKFAQFLASVSETNKATLQTVKNAEGSWQSSVEFGDSKKTYEEWVAETYSTLDEYQEALVSYGTTEEAVRGMFEANQANTQAQVTAERENEETAFYADARQLITELRTFWDFDNGTSGIYETIIWTPFMNALNAYWNEQRTFWGFSNGNYYTQFWKEFYDDGMKFDQRMDQLYNEMVNERDNWIGTPTDDGTVRGLLDTINTNLVSFSDSFDSWVHDWTDYYINHIQYTGAISSADWSEMLHMESAQSQDAVLALAQALDTLTDLQGQDPTVQSNVLLAKIVVLLEAIMQQNNSTGGLSLIDSLSAMSLGITNRTT